MNSPYKNLKRDCQNLHSFTSDDVKRFVELANLSKGMIVLDAMCGNGAVSKEIDSSKKIQLHLLDSFEFQLDEAKKKLSLANFVQASILQTPFEDETFDRIFIRNAVYEISKDKQTELFNELFRILKKDGELLVWTLLEEEQHIVQKIQREKDSIAGFDDLVKNRYFMTKNEFSKFILQTNFSKIDFFDFGINYTLSSKKWFEVDFNRDNNKLNQLNSFMKSLELNSTNAVRIEDGEDVQVKIPALIFVVHK